MQKGNTGHRAYFVLGGWQGKITNNRFRKGLVEVTVEDGVIDWVYLELSRES